MVEREKVETLEGELVTRYGGMVYRAAARQLGGEGHGAEDVTQAVFLVAMRKAKTGGLPEEGRMAGWLLKVTGYAVKEVRRSEHRRKRHEEQAAAGRREAIGAESDAGEVTKMLDESLLKLGPLDREMVVRRYLRGEGILEVGRAMGMTENTAGRRILRALEKLRKVLTRRGVIMPTAALTAVMSMESAKAATVTVVLSGGSNATAAGIAKGTMAMMKAAMLKAATGVIAVTLVVIGAGVFVVAAEMPHGGTVAPTPATNTAINSTTNPETMRGAKVSEAERETVEAALRARMAAMQNFSVSYEERAEFSDGKPAKKLSYSMLVFPFSGMHVTKMFASRLGDKSFWRRDDDSEIPIDRGGTDKIHLVETLICDARQSSRFLEKPNGTGTINRGPIAVPMAINPLIGDRDFNGLSVYGKVIDKMEMSATKEGVMLRWVDSLKRLHEWDLLRDRGYAAGAYRLRTTGENERSMDVYGSDFQLVKSADAKKNGEGIYLPQTVQWVLVDTNGKSTLKTPVMLTHLEYRLDDPANNDDRYRMKWPEGTPVGDVVTRETWYGAADGTLTKKPPPRAEDARANGRADEVKKRYADIFSGLDEKHALDQRIGDLTMSLQQHAETEDRLLNSAENAQIATLQKDGMVTLWNKIEGAAKEIAAKHGQSATISDDIPQLPVDLSGVDYRNLIGIIQKRMVIPLDEKMATEIVELLNARYAKERAAATQKN